MDRSNIRNKAFFQNLISEDRLKEALRELMLLINNTIEGNPRQHGNEFLKKLSTALIINLGKLNGLEHDLVLGVIDNETRKITLAEIRKSTLVILDKIPSNFWNSQSHDSKISLEDELITKVSKLHEKENENFTYDIFFCFSTKDRNEAQPIWDILRGYGLNVFVSDEDLQSSVGYNFIDKIDEAISNSQHLILYATKNALDSVYVRDEYQAFYSDHHVKDPENRLIFVFKSKSLSIGELPRVLKTKQIASNVKSVIKSLVAISTINNPKSIDDSALTLSPKLEEVKKGIQEKAVNKERTNEPTHKEIPKTERKTVNKALEGSPFNEFFQTLILSYHKHKRIYLAALTTILFLFIISKINFPDRKITKENIESPSQLEKMSEFDSIIYYGNQSSEGDLNIYYNLKEKKYGYSNFQNERITDPRYKHAFRFVDGVAPVVKDSILEFIYFNENGSRRVAVPEAYKHYHRSYDVAEVFLQGNTKQFIKLNGEFTNQLFDPYEPGILSSIKNNIGKPVLKTFNVTSELEFLNALGSDRIININSSELKFPESIDIKSVKNLTINGDVDALPRIVCTSSSDDVIYISDSYNITLKNLIIGHDLKDDFKRKIYKRDKYGFIDYGVCEVGVGVVSVNKTDSINIKNCKLFGCGDIGLEVSFCNNVFLSWSEIYKCTSSIIDADVKSSIIISNSVFYNNTGGIYIQTKDDAGKIEFQNCRFKDNRVGNSSLLQSNSRVEITNTPIPNNKINVPKDRLKIK